MDTESASTDASPTPGSDAEHTGLALAGAPSKTGGSAPRSCYACNQKKIRCDKKEPCSSCTRAGKPCIYPPAGPRLRRTKQTIVSEMAARIASLEKSLAEAREREASSRTSLISGTEITTPSPRPNTAAQGPCAARTGSQGEVLLQKGSLSQYFDEFWLSRVIGEEHNIRSALINPESESSRQLASSAFNPMGILSFPSPSIDPSSLHPTPELAVTLWNIYLDNVESWTTSKFMHIPTDEVTIYSVIHDPSKASYEDLALNFAIYFATTVTVEVTDAERTLGQNKESLLMQFKTGLEQSFARRDFLGRPTMNCLRALAIYLSALRIYNRSKGIWILNGLAVRTARSLGLHRDGEWLGLPPFQAEMRRRLWWHLLYREGRAGEDYGLENTACQHILTSDVRLPRNLDDTDIYPDIQQLPKEKPGWTAMTFSLVLIDLAKTLQKLAQVIGSSSPSSPPSEEKRRELIKELRASIEIRVEGCNPVIPKQRLCLNCSRFMVRKLDFTTKIQWIVLQRPGPHADFVTEENLIEALEILEGRLTKLDSLLAPFAWTRRAYPQYHVTMYILLHLCVKPDGPNVDRAWTAVEMMTALDLQDESSTGYGSKSAVLTALKANALSIREKSQRQGVNEDIRSGDRQVGTAVKEISADVDYHSACQTGDTGSYNFSFEGLNEWPTWTTFVQGFQIDSPGVLWQ